MTFNPNQYLHEQHIRELGEQTKRNSIYRNQHRQNKMLNRIGKLFVKVGQNLQDIAEN